MQNNVDRDNSELGEIRQERRVLCKTSELGTISLILLDVNPTFRLTSDNSLTTFFFRCK